MKNFEVGISWIFTFPLKLKFKGKVTKIFLSLLVLLFHTMPFLSFSIWHKWFGISYVNFQWFNEKKLLILGSIVDLAREYAILMLSFLIYSQFYVYSTCEIYFLQIQNLRPCSTNRSNWFSNHAMKLR